MSDLSTATIQEIVEELKSRNLSFALYTNLLAQYRAGGDVPSEERQESYGSRDNPALLAADFCDGIQMALLKIEDPDLAQLTACLSAQTSLLKHGLWQLAKFIDPGLRAFKEGNEPT